MVNRIICENGIDFAPDAYALFLCKECVEALGKLQLPAEIETSVKAYLEAVGDVFDPSDIHTLTAMVEGKLVQIVLAGCGNGKDCKPNNFRNACGEAIRKLRELKAKNVAVMAPIIMNPKRGHYLQAIAEGLYLGAYSFEKYKSEAKVPAKMTLGIKNDILNGAEIIQRAEIIAEAVSFARDLVNEPGNVVYPEIMAEICKVVGKNAGMQVEVLGEAELVAKNYLSIAAVGQGSVHKPCLITMKYEGAEDAPFTAYVGKGITFDSGGISIKPDDNMGEMKDDMTGAACVLGAIKAIAALKLPVNIMAVLACAENMPGGNAQRPGDIVRAANGKTIEVISTDAEGRMVLADAVYHACTEGAAKVVDIATLTGGVMVALGTKTSGIITNDEELGTALVDAGKRAGESLFVLPSLPELKEAIKSEVADLKNSAGRYGSCITGGLFIGEFITEGTPWAHIDIGGTSTVTETKGIKSVGGTAFGTMTLIRLAGDF